ncbi:MAG: selenide,water dikinase [Litorivivens sp.]|jgi:selenide,water dikinase
MEDSVKLTSVSKGAGCGCKMAPADLDCVLSEVKSEGVFESLLVGRSTKDDAAVLAWGSDDKAIISTTDFFTPIVDDPDMFGRISAANAISDVYAMGGKPLMALAILGWPLEKLGAQMAGKVVEGARALCQELGIPLAGGHSIDIGDPVFGLAVTGEVDRKNLKTNNGAKAEDILFLTKPLGTGIVATAQKRGVAEPEHIEYTSKLMSTPNSIGYELGKIQGVTAMTDVTGFGFLGHLIEMCEGSKVSAEVEAKDVPHLPNGMLDNYLKQFIVADNTFRNFKAYGHKVSAMTAQNMQVLCDPQTGGGLLIAVDPTSADEVSKLLIDNGISAQPIGKCVGQSDKIVTIMEG